jgi:hypothetical protein
LIFLATILFLAVLAWDIVSDYKKWLKERSVNHSKEWWIRVLALLPCIAILCWPKLIDIASASLLMAVCFWLISIASSALIVAVYFWLLFDGLYNVIRGYNWWYTGTDDVDDAKTDNLLQRLTLWQHILLKIGGCVAATILYTCL